MNKGNKKTKAYHCPNCKLAITKTQFSLQCAGVCNSWYHKRCTGLTDEQYLSYEKREIDEKWICNDCTNVDCSADEILPTNPSNRDILNILNKKFAEMEKALTFNGSMMEDMQTTIKLLMEENKILKKEQADLKGQVEQLVKEITVINKITFKAETEERKKNIVIVGLNGNKVEDKVKKVFAKLSINEETYKTTVLPTTDGNKPVVLVHCLTEELRNKVLEKRKQQRLSTENCGIDNQGTNIYINEDLPRPVREIFKKARELKQNGFKYVWSKNGQVYTRKNDGDPVIKINSISQVELHLK